MTKELFQRAARFCVVGASGVVVNMAVLILLTESLGLPYAVSSLFAIELSILSNFALNNAWTWSDRRSAPLLRRLIKYHAVAGLTAMAANWCVLVALTRFVGMDYRVSNLIGIAVGVMLNFYLNHKWTFRHVAPDGATASGAASAAAPSSDATVAVADQRIDPANGTASAVAPGRLMWSVMATIMVLTAIKILFAARAELFPEESYYWSYLQHPALGYFDHPPMVAWIIGVGTTLLGNTELGVRLGAILLSLGSTVFVFLLTRLWFGAVCACWAALAFNLLPIFVVTGLLAFPDGPLTFFWLLTMYALSKAIGIGSVNTVPDTRQIAGIPSTLFWLLAGLAFGGALLSKYTAVLLGGSLGLFLILSPTYRHWLRRPQPWLAGLIALLVFSPVIIWNAQHEWASFLFQSTRTVGQPLHPVETVTEFWLLQLFILGPMFVVFAGAIWHGVRRGWLGHEDRWNFAASFSLPLFLIFFVASFKTDVHINWTAPCFLSLVPVAAALFRDGLANRLRYPTAWRRFGWVVAVFTVGALGLALSVILSGAPKALASSRLGGWRELAALVRTREAELARSSGQKPFVLGADKYNLSAQLGFYNHAPENQINNLALGKHGLGFRYWTDLRSFEGRPALVVETRVDAWALASLTNHFDRVGEVKRIDLSTMGKRTRAVWLIDCYGYRVSPRLPLHAAAGRQPFGGREANAISNR